MSLSEDAIAGLAWTQLWQVTLLAAAIGLATRAFCRRRPHLAYVLWLLVLVKSLTPPVWASPAGLFSWSGAAFASLSAGVQEPAQDRQWLLRYGPRPAAGASATESARAQESGEAGALPAPNETTVRSEDAARSPSRVALILGLIWILGAALSAVLTAAGVVRLRRAICGAQAPGEPWLAVLAERLGRALGVREGVKLIVVTEPLGPLAYGCVRSTIVLPDDLIRRCAPEEIEPLLAHELVHVRRKDALIGLMQALAQCVWWFHPLIWWANRRTVEERERCCDEAVVAGLGCQPQRYAHSLLTVLEWKAGARWTALVPGVRTFEINRRRLEHLRRHSGQFRPAASRLEWLLLLAGFLLVAPGAALPRPAAGTDQTASGAPHSEAGLSPGRGNSGESADNFLPRQADSTSDSAVAAPHEATAPPAANPAPRGIEIEIYALGADGKTARRVAAIPAFPIINSPEVSPDGAWVAVDGWNWDQDLHDAHLLIVNLRTGELKDLGQGAMPSWAPDGKWIACSKYGPDGGVFIREVDGNVEELIDRDGWGILWSPDGEKLAYTRDGNIVVFNRVTGRRHEVFPAGEAPYAYIFWNCAWSPDSRRICFKGQRHDKSIDIAIVSATGDGPELRVRCEGQDYNEDIAWHPNGRRITIPRGSAAGQTGQIFEFDPDGDAPPALLAGQPADRNNAGMCWSRDGKTFYFVSYK